MQGQQYVALKLVKSAEATAGLARVVKPLIERHGFTRVTGGSWVRTTKGPIKELFGVGAIKYRLSGGGSLSFDHVPHVYGEKVRWHRAAGETVSDVAFDGESEEVLLLEVTPKALKERIARLGPDLVRLAMKRFNRVRTVEDVVDLVLELKAIKKNDPQRARGFGGLGYWNFPQLQLSLAFSHAYLGDKRKATKALEDYQKRFNEPKDVVQKLESLLQQQIESPGRVPGPVKTKRAKTASRRRS
jgi:hypothetical protein